MKLNEEKESLAFCFKNKIEYKKFIDYLKFYKYDINAEDVIRVNILRFMNRGYKFKNVEIDLKIRDGFKNKRSNYI